MMSFIKNYVSFLMNLVAIFAVVTVIYVLM